jgi:glycosyltransferase involved in cell wall biosynthesis
MDSDNPDPEKPTEFSILIGLVSTQDRERIFEVLNAIENQTGNLSYEVIIVDRCQDQISDAIDKNYPTVKRLTCSADTSLPAMRTQALNRADGRFIVVTEDHCVPSGNWLENFSRVFTNAPPETVAVGGCVNNGVAGSAFDRATFFCEYGAFAEPVVEGFTSNLPGMNIAYRHKILKEFDSESLERGFWESTIHPEMLKNGQLFYSSNSIRITHCKKFSFGLFARQRFLYSRYYADMRYPSQQLLIRTAVGLATLVLPVLLLLRSLRSVALKPALRKGFFSSIPVLFLFYVIWAWGEIIGYLLGGNDALRQLE